MGLFLLSWSAFLWIIFASPSFHLSACRFLFKRSHLAHHFCVSKEWNPSRVSQEFPLLLAAITWLNTRLLMNVWGVNFHLWRQGLCSVSARLIRQVNRLMFSSSSLSASQGCQLSPALTETLSSSWGRMSLLRALESFPFLVLSVQRIQTGSIQEWCVLPL